MGGVCYEKERNHIFSMHYVYGNAGAGANSGSKSKAKIVSEK